MTYAARWPQHCRERKGGAPAPGLLELGLGCLSKLLGAPALPVEAFQRHENPLWKRAFRRLRGKDSNLDYLIQSQASYH
jgi:hypothetical protein